MDSPKITFEVIENHTQTENVKFVSELAELQLAIVGGGCGEVLF